MFDGRKTYIGIAVIVLGYIGFGSMVSEGEIAQSVDNVLQLVGIAMAIYGRYKAGVPKG